MRLEMESASEEISEALACRIRETVRAALERHEASLGVVAVRLADRARGREQGAKRCHISIHLARLRSSVAVTEAGADLLDAAARAAHAAAEAVQQRLAISL